VINTIWTQEIARSVGLAHASLTAKLKCSRRIVPAITRPPGRSFITHGVGSSRGTVAMISAGQ
jgi:hypothetical protein